MIPSYPSHSLRRTLFGAAITASLLSVTQAAVVVNSFTNIGPAGGAVHSIHDPSVSGSPTLISASSTDLLQGKTATVTYTGGSGSTTQESSGGAARWTDGLVATVYNQGGSAGDNIDHAAYGTVNATVPAQPGGGEIDTFVTYDLGAIYNLTQIDVITGWNDSGRDDSSFNVLVSLDNVSFVSIATYLKGPDNTSQYSTPITNLHRITDGAAGNIASGIRFVQFQFTDADNGFAGVVELDAFGTAVPEASASLLGGIGALALLRRRR